MADAAGLHREYLEGIRDLARVRDLFHPDYAYTDPNGTEYGADETVAIWEAYLTAFPDLSAEILHQHVPGGDVSIMEVVFRGTHKGALGLPGSDSIPATGKQVESLLCEVIEVRDGKIYRERGYYDFLSLLQQLGVVPGG